MMAAKIEKMTFVSIVYNGTYEPSAQLSLKRGKSGVGFTMIKNDVFFQDFSIKSFLGFSIRSDMQRLGP